jgi:hypothetical protein
MNTQTEEKPMIKVAYSKPIAYSINGGSWIIDTTDRAGKPIQVQCDTKEKAEQWIKENYNDNFYINRAEEWLKAGQIDRISNNIAGLILGRNFNESFEDYCKRKPSIGEFINWWDEKIKARCHQIQKVNHLK